MTDWENRPRDAEGRPCDYFQELPNGTREPRWRRPPTQKRPTHKLDADRWYKFSEIQQYVPLSRATLTRACCTGALPAKQITPGRGSPWLVRGRDLADFLDAKKTAFRLPEPPR